MKSSQDQRNAIEELYKSGSISKEEYDEMIRIIEPEPTPKPDPNPKPQPTDKKPNNSLKIIGAVVAILIIGYGIKSFIGSRAEGEFAEENETAMSLAQSECDCEVSLLDEYLTDLVNLNNRIENNQLKYKSEARENLDEITNDLNSKKEASITCQDVEKNKEVLLNKYPPGTAKYNRLDSIYTVYLKSEKENSTGRYVALQEEIKQETSRYEELLEEKLGYESEDHKNAEAPAIESLVNNFFYYYNQATYNSINNAIFNYINLPFHFNGQSNLHVEQVTSIIMNERYSYSNYYYYVETSSADYKGKDGDMLLWKCKLRLTYSGYSDYQIYEVSVKVKDNKLSYLEIIR